MTRVGIKGLYFIFSWVLLLIGPAWASDPPLPAPGEISEQRIFKTLEELQSFGNRTTWEKQDQVAEYLYRQLQSYPNLEVSYHFYQHGGKTWKNVVVRCPGRKNPQKIYILCAHYDSHPDGLKLSGTAPGVDDNGTGVAVLLEGARILSENPGKNTVEWLFFSNEEQGHKGSLAYVKALKEKGSAISGVVNIDTIGYTQPSLKVLWQEARGKGLSRRLAYLAKQILKKPIFYFQTGFKNPDELLLVGGRPANALLVDKVYSRLKGAEVGIKKDVGPQCG